MRFKVEFQYRPKDHTRPNDYVQEFDMHGKEGIFFPIPDIGDHVCIEGEGYGDKALVVENRLFSYAGKPQDPYCVVNIVLTDSNVSPGILVKM